MQMSDDNPTRRSLLVAWWLLVFIPLLLLSGAYMVDAACSVSRGVSVIAYLLGGGIGLAACGSLPQLFMAWLAERVGATRHPRWHLALWLFAGLLASLIAVLAFSDFCIWRHFSFHINGFVINLLITPGGFSSMGLDYSTIIPAFLGGALCVAVYLFLACSLARRASLRSWCGRHLAWRWWVLASLALLSAFSLGYAEIACGVSDFYHYRQVLSVSGTYPLLPRVRMRSFLKSLGCKRPARTVADRARIRLSTSTILNYPLEETRAVPMERLPNIVWLCAESLRNDMLCEAVMPNSNAFAEKHCVRFNQHFSGGNGTRPGMFAMFYGIYANLWNEFLDSNRPPVFFEWLHDANYQLRAATSAKFTYPEFNLTVFAMLEAEQLEEMDSTLPPDERDRVGVDKMIDFIEKRDPGRPFFAFHFFEGTHAPYSFPEDHAPFQPVLENLSYLKMSADDRELVINRARNAAYNVDRQIGRLIKYLEEKGFLENTIVIVTGDHGEEFYEHGHLGHNSAFVDEQICPPLIIHLPGVAARKYERLSQHTDIIPTLAARLGRVGDASRYSVGHDLMDPDYDRQYMIVCGYTERVLVNKEGKYMLPVDPESLYSPYRLLRRDDSIDNDVDGFYRRNAVQLSQALRDMQRFLK